MKINEILYSNENKELLLHAKIWMFLTNTMLNERVQTHKSRYCATLFICNSNTSKRNLVTEVKVLVTFGEIVIEKGKVLGGAGNVLHFDLGGDYRTVFTLFKK